jgi:phosphate starvation-inducible membrane PsiE
VGEPQGLADKFVSQIEKVGMRVGNLGEKIGNQLVDGFDLVALFVIGGTVVWSAIYAYIGMIEQGYAGIKDILLLFIYLELGAMVGIHFKTHRLPVEFLLYVAITALTRVLVIDLKAMPDLRILVISGAIVVIALAVLVLHVGRSKFPTDESL